MADVFISYARASAEQAQAAASALRSLGYSVWIDADIPAHRTYSHVIEEQLSEAKAALVIWSPEAARSEWVLSEASRAREDSKLVQVRLGRFRLPMPFDQVQCADLSSWSGDAESDGWRKVVGSIAALVNGAAPSRSLPAGALPGLRKAPSKTERRHLTILSAHLANATAIAARLDPEEWSALVMQYQSEASAAVIAMGGHVDRSGDGLMVYFGYPEAQEDAAERAVRGGLAIIEAMAGLKAKVAQAHKVTLFVRVGVHAGTAVVVAPGAGADVAMFGNAPKITALVEAAAAPDAVVMTDVVHDLVSGLFAIEDLGAFSFEGVDEPTRLYHVLRPGLASGRGRGFGPREPMPFIGRDNEIHLLLGRWERVREGDGQLLLMTGEPGIGKSRVVDEFQARIKPNPHLWIECAGAPLFSNTPFHAVTQMFTQGLGWRGDEDGEERFSRLEQALEPTGVKLSEAVPLIAEMLKLPIPDRYAPLNLAPDQRRVRLLAAMEGWVFSATRRQPLVLVIEDLQWVDPSTMELVQTLVEQGAMAPLMLLCTSRPEFRPTWRARGHHAQVTLDRLNNRQTRELVAGVISRAGLAQDVVDAVIERADGVPLFAEELTRLMLEGDTPAGTDEIPTTLLDSLAARLDRLGRAKAVAQLASVVGREFSYELLRAVSSMEEMELQAGLAKLADAELIYARGLPPQATYRFKHALIQDAAYEALLKSERQSLHARVAATISETFPAIAEAQPEIVATHWTEAGEAEPAVAAWKLAGDAAYRRRAFAESETAYRQALAMLTTAPETPERDAKELELCSALTRVLQLTSGYAAPDAAEVAARARTLAEKSGNLRHVIREEAMIWRAIMTSGDYGGAAALADHILDLTHDAGDNPVRLLFAHSAQLQTGFYTGDLGGVEEHYEHLSPLIDSIGKKQPPGNNIVAIGVASLCAWVLGRCETAHQRIARAFTLAEESQNPYDLAMALHFRGNVYAFERNVDLLQSNQTQLLALCEEKGFSYLGNLGRGPLGWARGQLGDAAGAAAMMRQALADQARSGARVGLGIGLNRLAEVQALSGSKADAMATIEEALTANPQERIHRPESYRIRGQLRLELGEFGPAETDFRDAVSLAQEMGAKGWELRAATSLALRHQAKGNAAAARDQLIPICGWFAEGLDGRDLQDAKTLLRELTA